MMSNFQTFLILLSISLGITVNANNEYSDDQIKQYFAKVDEMFETLSQDRLFEWLIAQEKYNLIYKLMQQNNPANKTTNNRLIKEDPEAPFFKPKQPKPLSEESKKKDAYERIAKRYIGKIPSQVEDIIFYFTHFEDCVKDNVILWNRLLLHGKPGAGKTYLFTVLAEELQLPSLAFTASFFADKYIGESSKRIRKAFEVAKEFNKPLLIFIDEIDALATKRNDNTHNEHRATLITLLTELQELKDNKNIYVIAATNDIKSLDPAIKDRFAGSICEIKELTIEQRAQLFQKLFADRGVAIDARFAKRLAEVIKPESSNHDENFSNRDIENIVNVSLMKWYADCKKNSQNCKNSICPYVKQAIDSIDKKKSFANWMPTHCDGI